jgi:hypothetical protein
MPKTSQDQSKDTNTDSVRFAWTRQLKQAWTRLKNLARVWSGAALFLPAGAPCPTTMIWAWEGYGECKPEEESAMKVTLWLVSMSRQIFTYIYHYLLQSVRPCFCYAKAHHPTGLLNVCFFTSEFPWCPTFLCFGVAEISSPKRS